MFYKRSKRIEIKYHIREHAGPGGADLFLKVLCGPMFEAQASVLVGFKRSKSGTMIDRDKRGRMMDGGDRRKPSL